MRTTLVIGASENPERTSFMAIHRLLKANQNVVAIGSKSGEVAGVKIQTGQPFIPNIDTITLYLGIKNQIPLYKYILSLHPKRIIFNPGAENLEFEKTCANEKISVIKACTLVMLSLGSY